MHFLLYVPKILHLLTEWFPHIHGLVCPLHVNIPSRSHALEEVQVGGTNKDVVFPAHDCSLVLPGPVCVCVCLGTHRPCGALCGFVVRVRQRDLPPICSTEWTK